MEGSDKSYRYIILNGSWLDHLVPDHGSVGDAMEDQAKKFSA
jgi:hypothetical protein